MPTQANEQIRKTWPGSGCPSRSIAYCTSGCSAIPPNDSRFDAPMTRPFTSGLAAGSESAHSREPQRNPAVTSQQEQQDHHDLVG